MELSFIEYILFLFIGFLGGIVNTLAGGASIFILAILLFYGIPANVANGTNRLGMLVQNLTGTITFYRSGLLDLNAGLPFIIPSVIGGVLGALVATDIDQQTMELVIASMMGIMLIPMFYKPSNQKFKLTKRPSHKIVNFLIFLGIGFYGGFIQAGIGLVAIIVLSSVGGFSLIRANAIKMAVILIYTIPVFFIFVYKGHVEWWTASVLAVGQIGGTWFAGKYLAHHSEVNRWIKRLLIAMVVLTILKTIAWEDLWEWLSSSF